MFWSMTDHKFLSMVDVEVHLPTYRYPVVLVPFIEKTPFPVYFGLFVKIIYLYIRNTICYSIPLICLVFYQ